MRDEDRKRRLRQLEDKIQDPRSVANVDCLLVITLTFILSLFNVLI